MAAGVVPAGKCFENDQPGFEEGGHVFGSDGAGGVDDLEDAFLGAGETRSRAVVVVGFLQEGPDVGDGDEAGQGQVEFEDFGP
jgi:hypothetical protein